MERFSLLRVLLFFFPDLIVTRLHVDLAIRLHVGYEIQHAFEGGCYCPVTSREIFASLPPPKEPRKSRKFFAYSFFSDRNHNLQEKRALEIFFLLRVLIFFLDLILTKTPFQFSHEIQHALARGCDCHVTSREILASLPPPKEPRNKGRNPCGITDSVMTGKRLRTSQNLARD